MAEMTAEERAKARLEKFKQAKAKADADSSGFPKEEVPDFQCCVLKKDTPKIIRLVGNAPSMREVPSDALIVKGIVSLLIRVLSDHSPKEILDADLYFIDEIGLKEHLSPTRSNGLLAMIKQIRSYALAFSMK